MAAPRFLHCLGLTFAASALMFSGCASVEEGEPDNPDELTTVGEAGAAASEEGATAASFFVTKLEFTPFYTLGPQQASGPDLSLKKGERVKLVKRGFGFSQVEIEDGRVGYVATEALEAAPAAVPEETESPAPRSSAITRVYSSGGSREYTPPPDLPPLPELEPLPEPEEIPAFRY